MNPLQNSVAQRVKQAQIAAIVQRLQEKQAQKQIEQRDARSTFEQITAPIVGSIGNTFAGAVGGLGQLGGTAIEALTPWNSAGQGLRNTGTAFREAIARKIEESRFGTQARPGENSFITNLSSGVGSLAGSMGMYGAGRAAGLSRGAASAIPGTAFGLSAGGEQAQAAIDAKKSALQALLTGVVAGGAEGGLESLGVKRYAGMPQILQRMATEGAQEGAQSLAQSAVRASYDKVDIAEAIKQAGTEAGYGALVGGIGDVSTRTPLAVQKAVQQLDANQGGYAKNKPKSELAERPQSSLIPHIAEAQKTRIKENRHRFGLTNVGAKKSQKGVTTLSRARYEAAEPLKKITDYSQREGESMFKNSPIKVQSEIGWGTVREQNQPLKSSTGIQKGILETDSGYSDDAIRHKKGFVTKPQGNIISRGTPMALLDTTVPPKEIGTYYKTITAKAQELGMDSIYDFEYVSPKNVTPGWTDQAKGESIEPLHTLYLKDASEEVEKILERHQIDEYMMTEDGKTVELINLRHYNPNHDNFTQNAINAARALKSQGLLDKFQTGYAKIRHIGKENLAPYSFEQAQSDNSTEAEAQQLAEQPKLTSTLLNKLPTKKYVTKAELTSLIDSIPVGNMSSNTMRQIEKDQALEILDEIEFAKQPLLKGMKKGQINIGQFKARLRQSYVKTEPAYSDSNRSTGMDNLGVPRGESLTVVHNIKGLEKRERGGAHPKTSFFWSRAFDAPTLADEIDVPKRRIKAIKEDVRYYKEMLAKPHLDYSEARVDLMSESERDELITKRRASVQKIVDEHEAKIKEHQDIIDEVKKKATKKDKGKEVYVIEIQSDAFQQGSFKDMSNTEIEDAQRRTKVLQDEINRKRDSIKEYERNQLELEEQLKFSKNMMDTLKKEGATVQVGNLGDRQIPRNPNMVAMQNRLPMARQIKEQFGEVQKRADSYSNEIFAHKERIKNYQEELKNVKAELKKLKAEVTKDEERIYAQLREMQGEESTSSTGRRQFDSKYRRRMINETLVRYFNEGYTVLNLATPTTVARHEWGITVDRANEGGDNPIPYEQQDGSEFDPQDDRVDEGDIITYEGEHYEVLEEDGYQITVAPTNMVEEITDEKISDIQWEEARYRMDEAVYELKDELEAGITPAQAGELQDGGNFGYEAEQILTRIADGTETVNNDNIDEIREDLEQEIVENSDFDVDDYYPEHTIVRTGDTMYAVEGETTSLYVPSEYNSKSQAVDLTQQDVDFKPENGKKLLSAGHGSFGVLRNYYEFQQEIKKLEKSANLRTEYIKDDGYGNSWFRIHLNDKLKVPTF